MANWVVRSVATTMPDVEVLAGVEVFDGGRLAEAEALGVAGGLRVVRDGSDAGGPGEEGGAEVCDGVADGSDAAEACDDDTIQCCSPLR